MTDLVDGLVGLMNSNYTRPVNLGNPEEHTIMDFAKIIRNLVGKLSDPFYVIEIPVLDLFFSTVVAIHFPSMP